jgi:hypothetical protein
MGPVTSLVMGVLDTLDEEGRVFYEDFSMVGADSHVAVHFFPVQVIHYYVTAGHVAFSLLVKTPSSKFIDSLLSLSIWTVSILHLKGPKFESAR